MRGWGCGGGSSCKGILGTEQFTVWTTVLWRHEPTRGYTCTNTPPTHKYQNGWGNPAITKYINILCIDINIFCWSLGGVTIGGDGTRCPRDFSATSCNCLQIPIKFHVCVFTTNSGTRSHVKKTQGSACGIRPLTRQVGSFVGPELPVSGADTGCRDTVRGVPRG